MAEESGGAWFLILCASIGSCYEFREQRKRLDSVEVAAQLCAAEAKYLHSQIDQLDGEHDSLKSDVDDLESKVSDLESLAHEH